MGSNPINFQPRIITNIDTNQTYNQRAQDEYRIIDNRMNQEGPEQRLRQKLEKLISHPPDSKQNPLHLPGSHHINKAHYKHRLNKVLNRMENRHMDINQPGPSSQTPMRLAQDSNNGIAQKELLKHGANPSTALNYYG